MAGKTVKNKGIGATLKVDTTDAVASLKELIKLLKSTDGSVEKLKDQNIKIEISLKPFKDLETAAKTSMTTINKAFSDGGKKIQDTLRQNMVTSPTSPDFLNNLRNNLKEAEAITANAAAKIQQSLSTGLIVNGKLNNGIVNQFDTTNVNRLLNTIGSQNLNLSEALKASVSIPNLGQLLDSGAFNLLSEKELANRLKLPDGLEVVNQAISTINVGKVAQISEAFDKLDDTFDGIQTATIAQVGSTLNEVGNIFDAIDTAKIAQIGNAFETLDAIDTAQLVQTSEAIEKIGEVAGALDLAEMVQNLQSIERMNTLIEMADHAQQARRNVIELGNAIERVGNRLQVLGSGITKLGDGIQRYSSYMIKGFMALQYTLRGTIDSIVGGTSDLISSSIDEIKNLEQATIGFENYFGKKENGFDAEVLLDRIRAEAVKAQGVNAGDLAAYISQVAPVAANSDQAFDVTLGLLKAITYSGGSASAEMPNVVRNIRDVLAKGQAYAMDINQFNRAIPGLPGILAEMGLDQFLKNDQLTITKDNVSQVMAAFAKFNEPGSPVYDILEKMSETLGGSQEMTKETIIQSVSASMQSSGLLDIWKSMLRNTELQTVIQQGIDTVITTVANFLKSVGIEHLIEQAMNAIGTLGGYFGETIVPALKELLGLDQGESMQKVVDEIIKTLVNFGKGLIDGVRFLIQAGNWFKEHIFPWIKKIGEILGISGDSLAQWAGFFVTAAPLLSPLVKVLGSLLNLGGKLTSKLGNFVTNVGLQDVGGTAFSNGFGVSLLNSLNFGGMLKGTQVMLVGQVLKPLVQSALGGVEQPIARFGSALTELGTVFAGLTMAFGPIPGVIGTVIDAFALLGKELEYQAEQRRQERIEAIANSLEDLKKVYLDTTIETMKKAGRFAEGDEATQQAYSELVEWLEKADFTEFTDPNEALAMVMKQYQDVWIRWKTGDQVADSINDMLDPTSDNYVTGTTKLNKANADQYADKITAIYEKMLELGFVGQYASDMSNVSAYDLWKYLNKNNITIGSTQFLESMYAHLNDPDWLQSTLRDQEVEIIYKTDDTEAVGTIEELLIKNGFTQRTTSFGTTAWYTEAGIKVFADIDDDTRDVLDQLSDLSLGNNNSLLPTPSTTIRDNESVLNTEEVKRIIESKLPNLSWSQWLKWSDELKERILKMLDIMPTLPPYKSIGGYITPIYKASGGMARGVDTIPAMLAPGEYVQRSSAVSTAGLGVMDALNRGDLGAAYQLLGAKLTHNVNTTNNSAISNTDSHNQTTNFITQIFRNRSGGIGGGRRIGNLMTRR